MGVDEDADDEDDEDDEDDDDGDDEAAAAEAGGSPLEAHWAMRSMNACESDLRGFTRS
jgi:hypothetical protein